MKYARMMIRKGHNHRNVLRGGNDCYTPSYTDKHNSLDRKRLSTSELVDIEYTGNIVCHSHYMTRSVATCKKYGRTTVSKTRHIMANIFTNGGRTSSWISFSRKVKTETLRYWR